MLVSDNAKISRPRRKIDGLDQVIKAEQLKTRLFDAFDAAPTRDLARIIGKEGLEQFARGLAALHRPVSVDWAARFGLDQAESARPDRPATVVAAAPLRKPWKVKFDGPCSRCGRRLAKGTEAFWHRTKNEMYCLECAQA